MESNPLNSIIIRALLDKAYEKRKSAGSEIERIIKDCVLKDDFSQIRAILNVLREFTCSSNISYVKGGLIGLASVSLGLGTKVIDSFLAELLTPVFPCFNNPNPNVRYYAIETLCNICRVANSAALDMFDDIFCVIVQLSFEIDQNIKNAIDLLDRVMKDIVTESPSFNMNSFIPILREKLFVKDASYQCQMMVISWVSLLQTVPDVDMMPFLPQILDGIFYILESSKLEVKKMVELVLEQFMQKMEEKPDCVNYVQMINILVVHAQAQDPLCQKTAMRMILLFIRLSKTQMVPYLSGVLGAAIPCLDYEDSILLTTKALAEDINSNLMGIVQSDQESVIINQSNSEKFNISCVIEVLMTYINNKHEPCTIAALKWLYLLNEKAPNQMQCHANVMLESLVETISNPSDKVVLISLSTMAQIASDLFYKNEVCEIRKSSPEAKTSRLEIGGYFHQLMKSVIQYFRNHTNLLSPRGSFVIRNLCVILPPSSVYCCLSELLKEESDLHFAYVIVDVLSDILLTSKELYVLRQTLTFLESEEGRCLFVKLFGCWCHNAVATITLCLLCRCYEQANTLVRIIGDMDVTSDILIGLDRLIQMIESPIFCSLRLQLLRPAENPDLVEALYGILMLIPQSDAFNLLRRRLNCIPALQSNDTKKINGKKSIPQQIDFNDLISHFVATQKLHQAFRESASRKRIQSSLQQ